MTLKICIIRDDRLGDLILTLPVIEALKKENDVNITLIASSANLELANKTGLFDNIFLYKGGLINSLDLIKKIKLGNFDQIINCSPFRNRIYKLFLKSKKKKTIIFFSRYSSNSVFYKLSIKLIISFFYKDVIVVDRYQNINANQIIHHTEVIQKIFSDSSKNLYGELKPYNFDNQCQSSARLKIIVLHLSNKNWEQRKNILESLINSIEKIDKYSLIITTEKIVSVKLETLIKNYSLITSKQLLFDNIKKNKTYISLSPDLTEWMNVLSLASFVITPECGCSHVSTMLNKKTIIIYDDKNKPFEINEEYKPFKKNYVKLVFKHHDIVEEIIKILN
jgi:ADP-heptose:LPS heptosyltransferase